MNAEPVYAQDLRSTILHCRCDVRGIAPQWAAPVVFIDAPNGFGEETWTIPIPQSLIAWHLTGEDVISEVEGHRGLRVTRGDRLCNLQPAGVTARYRSAGEVRFAHFQLSDELLRRVGEGLNWPDLTARALRPDLIMFEDIELWRQLDTYAQRSAQAINAPSRIEMEARALMIVERLLSVHHFGRTRGPKKGGLASWQLKRTCEAMTARLDADLGLDDLAAIAGCSPTHFSRAFKQSTGLAPFHWLTERRIEKAKYLLEESKLSLAEIALAVGFSAQPQFTTAFGRATGRTPGAWRRERLT